MGLGEENEPAAGGSKNTSSWSNDHFAGRDSAIHPDGEVEAGEVEVGDEGCHDDCSVKQQKQRYTKTFILNWQV